MIAMQMPRSSRTSRIVFIFFMRVLYQGLVRLSSGNLDFLASLSVIPALEVLIQVGDNLLFREPVISTLVQDAVDNILLVPIRLETEGGEVSERLDVFVLHALIIPCPGQNARGKKKKVSS